MADKLKFTAPQIPEIHIGVFVSLWDCKAEKKSPPNSLKGAQRNKGKKYERATSFNSGVSRPIQETNKSVIHGETNRSMMPNEKAKKE